PMAWASSCGREGQRVLLPASRVPRPRNRPQTSSDHSLSESMEFLAEWFAAPPAPPSTGRRCFAFPLLAAIVAPMPVHRAESRRDRRANPPAADTDPEVAFRAHGE